MFQVHTGACVSLLAPGKTDYTSCHPKKTTTYILHVVTNHYAYARETQVNWKKRNKEKKRMKKKGEERKDKGAKKARKVRKERRDKKRNKGRKGENNAMLANPKN